MSSHSFADISIINRLMLSNKELSSDLSNVDMLSTEEWESLIKYFLTYVTAGSIPAITMGICHLKYIHDISPTRFDSSIISIMLAEESIDLNDSWDYNNLFMMLEICNCQSTEAFLNYGIGSNDDYVSQAAKELLNQDSQGKDWYKFYQNEYKVFIRKLNEH